MQLKIINIERNMKKPNLKKQKMKRKKSRRLVKLVENKLSKPRQPITYRKYPKLNDLIKYLKVYTPGEHEVGDIVKFKNMIVQIAEYNRPVPVMFKLNPRDIEYFLH